MAHLGETQISAKFQHLMEQVAHEQTHIMEQEANSVQSGRGLKLFRGTVVAVDANNWLQIRRSTSVDTDANGNQIAGPPDHAYYPQASPGMLAKVGDEVFGTEVSGKPIIMGLIAGSGYKDLKALAGGNLDDFVLQNSKYASDSVNSRVLQDAQVYGYHVSSRTIQGTNHLILRSVLDGEIGLYAIANTNYGSDTISDPKMQTDSVGNRIMKNDTVQEVNQQTSSHSERVLGYDVVGANAMRPDTIAKAHMVTDSIGNREIIDRSVRTWELSDTVNSYLHSHSTLDFQSDYTPAERAGAIQKALNAKELLNTLADGDPYATITSGQAQQILQLLLEVWRLNADDQHYTAEQREVKLKNDPDYRHEYLLKYQSGYAEALERESKGISARGLIRHAHANNGHNEVGSVEEAHHLYDPRFQVTREWLDERIADDMEYFTKVVPESIGYLSEEELQGMITREDMLITNQQAHLDNGGTFTLEMDGAATYVCRKTTDGAYVVYSNRDSVSLESALQRALPMAAPEAWKYAPSGDLETALTAEEDAMSLADFTPRQLRTEFDTGSTFAFAVMGEEEWRIGKTVDGSYIVYCPARDTFSEALSRMSGYGPAWRWLADDAIDEAS